MFFVCRAICHFRPSPYRLKAASQPVLRVMRRPAILTTRVSTIGRPNSHRLLMDSGMAICGVAERPYWATW